MSCALSAALRSECVRSECVRSECVRSECVRSECVRSECVLHALGVLRCAGVAHIYLMYRHSPTFTSSETRNSRTN